MWAAGRLPRRATPAQALVEAALVVPLLLLVAFGGIGIGRLVQVRMALSAATREAAHATAVADMPRLDARTRQPEEDAERTGRSTGEQVARGFGLRGPIDITVDAEPFEPDGWVTATMRYTVTEDDLPFIRNVFGPRIELDARHIERIDRYRGFAP